MSPLPLIAQARPLSPIHFKAHAIMMLVATLRANGTPNDQSHRQSILPGTRVFEGIKQPIQTAATNLLLPHAT